MKLIKSRPRLTFEWLNNVTPSEALRVAERQTAEAQSAKDAGDPGAEEQFQQWSDILDTLRVMHGSRVPDTMKRDSA